MRVVGISGSHRLKGNSEYALSLALEQIAAGGFETEIITLADKDIDPCMACDSCRSTKVCRIEDDFQEVFERVVSADGLIFACPVYTFAPPPRFLAFRTRLSRLSHARGEEQAYSSSGEFIKAYPHHSALRRKPGGTIVLARRAGADLVLAQINTFFQAHEMYIVGAGYLNVAFGYHRKSVIQDEEGIRNIIRFGENFRWLLEKLS